MVRRPAGGQPWWWCTVLIYWICMSLTRLWAFPSIHLTSYIRLRTYHFTSSWPQFTALEKSSTGFQLLSTDSACIKPAPNTCLPAWAGESPHSSGRGWGRVPSWHPCMCNPEVCKQLCFEGNSQPQQFMSPLMLLNALHKVPADWIPATLTGGPLTNVSLYWLSSLPVSFFLIPLFCLLWSFPKSIYM